ncbi:MAG: glycosyltransferase, partial [Caulobacteraceae bacterium]
MSELMLSEDWSGPVLANDAGAGLRHALIAPRTHLVDTTMLFAPKSGGVKRYLQAKQDWMRSQPEVRHTLVVPGARSVARNGVMRIAAPPIPFTDGYRCPTNLGKWTRAIMALDPDIIEAGDPYIPGHAAVDAGEALGVPVVGFCHTDAVAL